MISIPNSKAQLIDADGRATPIFTKVLNAISGLTLNGSRVSGSTAYNPPSIGSGATATTMVLVAGAIPDGTQTAQASFSISLGGLILSAYVSAINQVTVQFYNPTGGAIDLGPGTLTAYVVTP